MSGTFILGLLLLIASAVILFFIWRELYLYNKNKREGKYYYTEITKKKAWIWTGCMCSLTAFTLIYGYFIYSPHLSNRYDQHNGYMTVVEYNMRGDSIIKENIRTPKTTYGKVISSEKGSHFVGIVGKGGHRVTHYDIKVRLDDGRIKEDRYNGSSYEKYTVGYKVRYEETFYPQYYSDLIFE